ncbi:XdhC family protein [Bacillus sp. 165]|uniref:XdhC family protein n=1 Tax=Bacillus sp. 165 TaxID=1529117 RepID=UPI001ADAD7C2|nr:XdhC family protein [Bacillus sp. 165]MBO9131039.1 XdhC family protein [Bacillus sp. 165]
MDNIHKILHSIDCSSRREVFATIIHIEGSAYRKEGTSMLIKEDGTQVGILSGGCLETDLALQVKEVLDKGLSRTLIYDMRDEDDLSWGQGAGCNGVVHVLLEPIDGNMLQHLNKVKTCLEDGKEVMVVKKLTNTWSVSDYLFLTEDGAVFGEWTGILDNEMQHTFRQEKRSGLVFIAELSAYVYLHTFLPKPRLIIFGAGYDAMPLASLASKTGFYVTVSDWREALCNKNKFPEADQCIVGFPKDAITSVKLTPRDFVVILTHHFQRDQELLELLLNKQLRYLGILGSKLRMNRLFKGKEVPSFIKTPVGLPIGAEGPEEIAVSILAQLIQILRKPSIEVRFSK